MQQVEDLFLLWFSWRKRSLMTPIWQDFIAKIMRQLTFFLLSPPGYRTEKHLISLLKYPMCHENVILSWEPKIKFWSFESWIKNSFWSTAFSVESNEVFLLEIPCENERSSFGSTTSINKAFAWIFKLTIYNEMWLDRSWNMEFKFWMNFFKFWRLIRFKLVEKLEEI